jgi:hypothetical protein
MRMFEPAIGMNHEHARAVARAGRPQGDQIFGQIKIESIHTHDEKLACHPKLRG